MADTGFEPHSRLTELLRRVAGMVPRMQQRAESLDRDGKFPDADLDELREAGALSAIVPHRAGGLGLGTESRGALGLFKLLRMLGRGNLATGRIFEGHVNALCLVAIYGNEQQLCQAAEDARDGHLFAVWNTEPPEGLRIVEGTGAILNGYKVFCSAAGYATRALVTAKTPDGASWMLLIPLLPEERVERANLIPQGMRASITGRVVFDGLPVGPQSTIGQPKDYLREPAFSAGAWRTCAVTLGGLEALVKETSKQLVARNRHHDPHQQSRIGRALIAEETARLWTRRAALIAEGNKTTTGEKTAYVNLARNAVEAATMEAIHLVQRSLGLMGFLQPNPVERLTRDLGTYLRQPAPDEALTEAADWYMNNDLTKLQIES